MSFLVHPIANTFSDGQMVQRLCCETRGEESLGTVSLISGAKCVGVELMRLLIPERVHGHKDLAFGRALRCPPQR